MREQCCAGKIRRGSECQGARAFGARKHRQSFNVMVSHAAVREPCPVNL